MSEILLFICSAQTFPPIFWTTICRDDSFLQSLHIVSFTTNSCPFIQQVYTRLNCITSKVPFTVFMFKASQFSHHRKSPSSWLFIVTQPDTNHSLGRLANFVRVLPGLKLCSSFAHLATLQETHKPTFTQAESKTNNVHPGLLQYLLFFCHERLTIPLHDIASDATSTPQAKQLWPCKFSNIVSMFTWHMAGLNMRLMLTVDMEAENA